MLVAVMTRLSLLFSVALVLIYDHSLTRGHGSGSTCGDHAASAGAGAKDVDLVVVLQSAATTPAAAAA
jgi:hypothetical protein